MSEALKPNPGQGSRILILPPAGPEEMARHVDHRVISEEGLRGIRTS